ncbi:MAG: hypothetical protein KAT58_02690 [candidate division Zixibacteria bacterium]|nr:hypothetical protein [candidate division Zixibacteria bacterium]
MYKIEKRDYGFRLTFGDVIDAEEMTRWLEESKTALPKQREKFTVFVDMRTLVPLAEGVQPIMTMGQMLYRQKGMERSVVILQNRATTMQFKRIALQSGIYDWERYIDASTTPNWDEVGLNWILKAIDPDQKPAKAPV